MSTFNQLRFDLSLPREDFTLAAKAAIPMQGITGVFGPSGSGKTSLLRCIAGLEAGAQGEIRLGEEVWLSPSNSVPSFRRNLGYVFQDARLFAHLTVRGNLEYAQKRCTTERAPKLDDVIALLGLDALLHRRVDGLSGGEQQRVAMARATLRAPSLLLLDEPVASLDRARKDEVLPLIRSLHATLGIPVLYVSHQIDEICQLCDELLVMEGGKIIAAGALQDLLMRTDIGVLSGAEAGSVIRGRPVEYDDSCDLTRLQTTAGDVWVAGEYADVETLRLRLRANDISLCRVPPQQTSILNVLPATIEAIQEDSAHSVLVRLSAGNEQLLARLTRRSLAELDLAVDDDVYMQIKSVSVRHQRPTRAIAR